MKHTLLLSLFFLVAGLLSAQATYNLSFAEVSNDRTTYTVDALLSFTEDMDLATSNMVFNYNSAGIVDPVFEDMTDLNTSPVPFYTVSVTNPSVGRASINVVLNIQDFGDLVTSEPILLARISFTIIDTDQTTDFVWRYDGDQATTGTVVFQDDPGQTATTLLNANLLTGLDRDLGQVVLPVELQSFTGRAEAKHNILNWTTALEENFSHYELQRSTDGAEEWTALGIVQGAAAGAVEGQRSYAWTDETPLPAGYYRLRMVDFDGSEGLSDVVYLERPFTDGGGGLTVYPNPTSGRLTVDLNTEEPTTLQLFSLSGKLLATHTLSASRSDYRIDQPAGAYLLMATSARGTRQTKIVVR